MFELSTTSTTQEHPLSTYTLTFNGAPTAESYTTLEAAVEAIEEHLAHLPLDPAQQVAHATLLGTLDGRGLVASFIRRDGKYSLTYAVSGQEHTIVISYSA